MAASDGRSDAARPDASALADEAEAEAAEAEAQAAAARARAETIRQRMATSASEGRDPRASASEGRDPRASASEAESEAEPQAESEAEAQAESEAEPQAGDGPGGSRTHTEHVNSLAELGVATQAVDKAEPGDNKQPGDDAEPVDDVAGSETGSKRRRWVKVVVTAVTIAIVLGLCGASGYLVWHHRDAARERQRAAEFESAARQAIVNMTSVDYHRATEDVQRLIDSSTGEFRDDFVRRAPNFTATLGQAKVVSVGTVSAAAIESMNANSAVVLVAVSSRVSIAAGSDKEPRYMRLSVTMTRDGGQLKMSKVELIP